MVYTQQIQYIDYYDQGERRKNAGFAKLILDEDLQKIDIRIEKMEDFSDGEYEVWLVPASSPKEPMALGKIRLENGSGVFSTVRKAGEQKDDVEIKIYLGSSKVLTSRLHDFYLLKRTDPMEEKKEIIEKKEENNIKNEREASYNMTEEKWEQLWSIYPHKNPFGDEREYLIISPRDFVIFQKESYKMVKNSFLLHGYGNYKYLILWKNKKMGEERFFVGVPGLFYEKECEAAVFFGFESFEGKKEPPAEGDFGFYMKRIYL